jgi:hypothetical protein
MNINIEASRPMIKGLASAGLMMAFFGAAWWGWGVGGLQGLFEGETIAFFTILGLATIILMVGSILLLRAENRLPKNSITTRDIPGQSRDVPDGKAYGLIFGLEIVFIVICSILLSVFNHPEFRLPFVCIIVGIHFLPLGKLFNIRMYYVVGALLVLASVMVMLAVPVSAMLGNLHAWDVLVGSICAVILWSTGLYAEMLGNQFLNQTQERLKSE